MPIIPDVIEIGPFPLPTFPLALLAGLYLWHALAIRQAAAWNLNRELVEEVLYRVMIGGVVGAKLVEVLRSPASFVSSPRLLVSVPTGTLPLLGALTGAVLWGAVALRRRWRMTPRVLDALTAPLLFSLGVMSAGSGGARALPMAAGFVLAGAALGGLRRQAAFDGHTALGGIVFGSLVVVASDFLRPSPILFGGLSALQVAAAFLGAGAYMAAVLLQRRFAPAERPDR